MKTALRFSLILAALAALAATSAHAQVSNGTFTSSLTGWTATGDASVRTSAAFLTTASLTDDDDNQGVGFFNFSGSEPTLAADLETALGLTADALHPDAGNAVFAFEGSAITQSVTLAPGEALTFSWEFLSETSGRADYALLVINGVPVDFSTAFTLVGTTTFGYDFTTGVQTYTSAPSVAGGTVLIGFGVVDVNDFVSTSALFIDNVSVIPEPASFAALAGLAGLGLAASRRRRA